MPDIFTVTQLAAYLKVNRVTILRYLKEGRFKAFKIGLNYRIPKESVEEFIKEGTRNVDALV